ncbi:DUF3788 domain-containing protein [Luteibacter yeojuensis]|uniref:DUF3788 domain-containing protein n=1 Tax=Luteibacter yeojuensis TaxID=345309 RepID=A0A7X5QWC3_9GAMM|nr:DUF3788 domain-containing protein [Luteibacter yeojuensis]NID16544.1 DUF3788 domain-containing protein [Luteibacter yeojuensis]
MTQAPAIGGRMSDRSATPDDGAVRDWIGARAFGHWTALRNWIDASYPGVFAPEWLYGGQKRGWTLRYKKTRALCTLVPGYRQLSVQVILGRAEREAFEERRYLWRAPLVARYDEAREYPDGKWLTVPVASADDRQDVIELVSMKRPPPSRR